MEIYFRECPRCELKDVMKRRQRICDQCQQVARLYNGMLGRLKTTKYAAVRKYGVVSQKDFFFLCRWRLGCFQHPSVNRKDPDRGYTKDNIEIIEKKRNSGLARRKYKVMPSQVEDVYRLVMSGAWTQRDAAGYYDVKESTISKRLARFREALKEREKVDQKRKAEEEWQRRKVGSRLTFVGEQ